MGKRGWSALGAILMALLEALGLATQFFNEKAWYLPLVVFLIFCGFVLWHIHTLHVEIDVLDQKLNDRARRRWLREQLDVRFFRKYKDLSESGDWEASERLDEELRRFCDTEEELRGYWAIFAAGSQLPTKTPPSHLGTDVQQRTWFKSQTRTLGLSTVIRDHLKD